MRPYREYYPQDESPREDGDAQFRGVNLKTGPEQLPPEMVSFARNARFTNATARKRRGRYVAPWLHLMNGTRILPWNGLITAGQFSDPATQLVYLYVVTSSGVWRCLPGNQPQPEAVPTYVKLQKPCYLVQAFGQLLLYRGQAHSPLVLNTVGGGFSELIKLYDSTVSYNTGDVVRYGPYTSPSSIVCGSNGIVTVVTSAEHGLAQGQMVRMAGAATAAYNGFFAVSVVDPLTFTYATNCSAGAAGGSPTWSPEQYVWQMGTPADAAGTAPGAGGAHWTRYYFSMPNGAAPVYTGNRVLACTAFLPGSIAAGSTTSGAYGPKPDLVAVSDILDATKVSLSNEFRINQGSADSLLGLAAMGQGQVIAIKSQSVHRINGVTGDLSGIYLQQLPINWGAVNDRAFTVASGTDLIVIAPQRGVCSIGLTVTGESQGVDLPLSDPIDPLLRRVNWGLSSAPRVAYCQNKLYAALPLDSGTCLGVDLVAGATYTSVGVPIP
jgi:hypothetical protein